MGIVTGLSGSSFFEMISGNVLKNSRMQGARMLWPLSQEVGESLETLLLGTKP